MVYNQQQAPNSRFYAVGWLFLLDFTEGAGRRTCRSAHDGRLNVHTIRESALDKHFIGTTTNDGALDLLSRIFVDVPNRSVGRACPCCVSSKDSSAKFAQEAKFGFGNERQVRKRALC